jgi:hypothetical protein
MTDKNFMFDNKLTDEQWVEFGTWVTSHLKMGPMTITFTKKDGTERVMNCTLQPELLPEEPIVESTEPKKERKENTSSLRVFDLEKKEWRSFIIKNVKQVKFDL